MKKQLLLLFTLLIAISCSLEKEPVTDKITNYEKLASIELPEKPNILWITYEDQMSTLGCFGDPIAITPNIDKLADEGVRFTNVFSCAGVCAPSRSGLITGMYPTSIGTHHMRTLGNPEFQPVPRYSAVIPEYVKCYSEYLRMAGYYCTNNSKEDYQFIAPVTAWDESSRKAHWKNRPNDKPFFAIFNFTICHESGMWKNKDHPLRVDPADVDVPPYYPDNEVVRNEIARNYSNVWEMDSLAGIVVKELEEEGLLESTIIFVYSDHGGPLPRQKREIYDSGMKVPMVIRFPNGQMAGEVVDELLSFIDFAPTLLSLAKIDIPNHLQGQAFLGNKQASPREYVYAARDRLDDEYDMVRAVRDKRFKYIKNYQPEKPNIMDIEYRMQMTLMQELWRAYEAGELVGDQLFWFSQTKPEEEFYDTENDPHEINNLAADPTYKNKLEELRQVHLDWQEKYGDMGFTPEEKMISDMWQGKDQAPSTEDPVTTKNGDKLTINCNTAGASIGIKIIRTGNEPAVWDVYTQPVVVEPGDLVKIIAHRIGFEPSNIMELKI